MSGRRDQHDPGQQGRTEPTLGNLDSWDIASDDKRDELPPLSIDPEQRRQGSSGPPRRDGSKRRWWLPVLLLLVVAAGGLCWVNQDKLRALIPNTALNSVLGRADAALANGRLDGNEGNSARELYQAALALEPDNDRARDGLRQVGQAEVAQADAALRAGQLDKAEQATAAARELLGGGSDVERLTQAINQARGAKLDAGSLIDQAQAALAAGRYDGDDGAGALYKRVLAADPGNAVAAHGLDQVGDGLAAQAHKALDANDLSLAAASVDQLSALLPGYAELPSLRAGLAQAQRQSDGALAELLKKGTEAMHAGRFRSDGGDDALSYFKAALQRDPDNAEAKAGLGQVAQALVVQANAAIDGADREQARKLLGQAAELAPKSAELAAAQARLGEGESSAAASASVGDAAAAPPPSPQQQAELSRLLDKAKAAIARGDIMLPPGDCAYDLYRSALAIDGNNADARAGLQQLPQLVGRQFDQALAAGDLPRASDMLSSLGDLSPADAGLNLRRQRLAAAWLDLAAQRLSHGDKASAADAWAQARKLDPGNPRLQDLGASLAPADAGR